MENLRSRTCIWLVNTLLSYRKLTLRELSQLWREDEDMSGGGELSRLRLQRAISAALDMLGVVIECDVRDGYRYYISANENLKATQWLISSQAIHQTITQSEQLRDRILLEEIPSGQHHLTTLISAMNRGKAIEMAYQKFADSEPVTAYVEPYCIKLSQQRWYLLGRKDHRDHLQVFALDRIQQLRILPDNDFVLPQGFSPREYFAHYFGVHTGSGMLPQQIRLRADAFWSNYLRTLPLHASQRQESSTPGACIFAYEMAVTPDLVNHLLTFGSGVEVLQPQALRDQLCDSIARMASLYRLE